MKSFLSLCAFCFILPFMVGCAGYTRGTSVPQGLRKISVPAFENHTEFPMVGATVAHQIAVAIIEDGTFQIVPHDEADLQLSGDIRGLSTDALSYDRNNNILPSEYTISLTLSCYAIDALTGERYLDGRKIVGQTTMLTQGDYQTAVMNALPRAAKDLAKNLLIELHTIEAK